MWKHKQKLCPEFKRGGRVESMLNCRSEQEISPGIILLVVNKIINDNDLCTEESEAIFQVIFSFSSL